MIISSRLHPYRKENSRNEILCVSLMLMALLSSSLGVSHGSLDRAAAPVSIPPTAGSSDVAARGDLPSGAANSAAAVTDDFLTFCVDFDELPEELARSRDYRVVAVTGCQCSGKSTLLNALFGTG